IVRKMLVRFFRHRLLAVALGVFTAAACPPAPVVSRAGANGVTPGYNKQTGGLAQLVADRQGGGRGGMRAHMTRSRVNSIEIDRDRDGKPDRWEYYGAPDAAQGAGSRALLLRAEEANGTDGKITRWEYFDHGVISRIEEDTDGDGKVDKWESYDHGAL